MTPDERNLLRLYRALPKSRREGLIDYAEYLLARTRQASGPPTAPPRPLAIPRPQVESVVQAIKRLSATYPMLKRDALLHQVSRCMTDHVLHRRPAREIIDELEALFLKQYEALAAEVPPSPNGVPNHRATAESTHLANPHGSSSGGP